MNTVNILGKIISLVIFSLVSMAMEEPSETEMEEPSETEEEITSPEKNKMAVNYLVSPVNEENEKNDFFTYNDTSNKQTNNAKKKPKITCKFCDKQYVDDRYYARHLRFMHWDNFVNDNNKNEIPTNKCNTVNCNTVKCKTVFLLKDKISKSKSKPNISYKCANCRKEFKTNLGYKRHLFKCN